MGHLVNPTAMRLGWFTNWVDSWFAEHIYYSEYLYIMFRIRFFLTLLLNSYDFEEMGFFYSHFEFLYKVNCLFIDIYLYDGHIESDIEFFFFDNKLMLKRLRQQYREKLDLNVMWFRSWKVMIVLTLIHYFWPYNWSMSRLYLFLKCLYDLDINRFFFFIKKNVFYKDYFLKHYVFMLFFLLRALKPLIDPTFIHLKVNRHIYLTRLIFNSFYIGWRYYIMLGLKKYVTYVMKTFISFHKNIVSVYYITSYAVTAKFLSRYIARKLHQNYRIGELLYPIKSELNTVMGTITVPLTRFLYNITNSQHRLDNLWSFRSNVFKYLISFLVNLYNKFFTNFNKITNSWFSFDMILTYNFLLKNINLSKIFFGLNRKIIKIIIFSRFIFNFNIKPFFNNILFLHKQNILNKIKNRYNNSLIKNKKLLYLFNLCFCYIYNRQILVYIYENGSKEFNIYLKSYFKPYSLFRFEHNYDFHGYIEFIFNNLYINLNNLIFWKNNFILNFKYLLHSNKYLNRFLKYNYWTYNMNWLFGHLHINKLKVRLGRKPTPKYLLGFKFHCLGRFTRRQRAISRWIYAHRLPLNTLSAFIDYGFYTIPLRNSAIAVKVWLYKHKNYNEYYFKVA